MTHGEMLKKDRENVKQTKMNTNNKALRAEMLAITSIDIDQKLTDDDAKALTDAFIIACDHVENELTELENVTDTDEGCDIISVDISRDTIRASSCIIEDTLFKIRYANHNPASKGRVLANFTRSTNIQIRLYTLCDKLGVRINDIRDHYKSRGYEYDVIENVWNQILKDDKSFYNWYINMNK